MTETISLDTAIALKAAGYPQPELQVGQFWYAILEQPSLCVVVESFCNLLILRRLFDDPILRSEEHLTCYAPGASELLKALEHRVSISFEGGIYLAHYEFEDRKFESDSAAEALAQAWLYIKQRRGRI